MRTSHRFPLLVSLCIAVLPSCSSSGGAVPIAVDEPESRSSATTELAVEAAPGPPDGSCVVSSVGAVSISFSSPGGPSAVSSDYWLPEGVVSPIEPIALLATCTGVDGTVVSFSADSDVLAFEPGTYELRTEQVGVFLPDAILQPTTPVPMTLTRFDTDRVTGSMVFDAAGSDGITSNFRIDFDLANPMPG